MPLVPNKADPKKPDWAIVQKAWRRCHSQVLPAQRTCPQRMPLEMRIMGDNNVIMAPQRGNNLGTCVIEIFTLYSAKDDWVCGMRRRCWVNGCRQLRDAKGRNLRLRPHWAKQWKEFTVRGKPWADVLCDEVYKEEIFEFKRALANIGRPHRWDLGDLKERFSNDFFDWFYFDHVTTKRRPRCRPRWQGRK